MFLVMVVIAQHILQPRLIVNLKESLATRKSSGSGRLPGLKLDEMDDMKIDEMDSVYAGRDVEFLGR